MSKKIKIEVSYNPLYLEKDANIFLAQKKESGATIFDIKYSVSDGQHCCLIYYSEPEQKNEKHGDYYI